MILHAIELTHVGPFREPVRLGPFAPGINLLAGPNETGKSTALRAAARALFDRHTTRGEELKSLQPAGTDLAPRVAVEFETAAGRHRIEKTFLQSPRSLLLEWHDGAWRPVAEADAADQRMQELLRSSLPGRGATKPEHWGMFGFLWARQGEPAEWPRLEDESVGLQIRARLARVELDPVIEQLRGRLAAQADAVITATGQPRTGGPLRQAEDELAEIEAELAALRATRAELDAMHQRHQRAAGTVAQLEQEHAGKELQAKALAEQAGAAERLRGELEARLAGLAVAQEKLMAVAADAAAFAARQADARRIREGLTQAEQAEKDGATRLAAVREMLDQQQNARPPIEARLTALRASQQRSQALLRLRRLAADAALAERQCAKAEAAAAQVAALTAEKARLPAVTPAQVRRLDELTERVRTQRAQGEALGLTVELLPEKESSVRLAEDGASRDIPLPAGKSTRLHRPQSLELEIAGWGRLTIRSGAKEAQTLARELAESEAALQAALEQAGVATPEAAREALALAKELAARIKTAETAVAETLGEHASVDALRTAAAAAKHRAAALEAALQPAAEETAAGNSELEVEEARLGEEIPAAERALQACDKELALRRTEERHAAEAWQRATAAAADRRIQLRTLESQAAGLADRYPDGLDGARTRAQLEFAQAEARVAATRAGLPPEFEKLPERHRRAAVALQQLANDLQAARGERDGARGALESLGGQGIYSRETELEESQAGAQQRRDAARARGWAARIAHDLIEHRKQAATRAVLTPLEERLTAAFAELTGERGRRVFLDDRLQIAGVGRSRAASHAFDGLSQGAKEQLLLCLRIAVAQELAADEPQVLVLDDVLVNTDPLRQERVLDVLGALSDRLQVILLTCHADRCRGVGNRVDFQRATDPAA